VGGDEINIVEGGKHLMQIIWDEKNPRKAKKIEKLYLNKLGRLRDVEQGPDGFLCFCTSNQDGRGIPQAGDDKIYRLKPKAEKGCW